VAPPPERYECARATRRERTSGRSQEDRKAAVASCEPGSAPTRATQQKLTTGLARLQKRVQMKSLAHFGKRARKAMHEQWQAAA